MSNNKLSITKFRIARLHGTEKIRGGAQSATTTDGSDLTDNEAPTEPVCIKTSKEIIHPDPFAGG